ncbi:hypothetical protein [Gordonia sp. (in: high G+C Gram-positive bacteria)]|uniref:hypothetical protein n=1 Tax=Gordonia sp. (in: high G+C Gram-positive bacteria) TaxID=84139 RepID=UPI0033407816
MARDSRPWIKVSVDMWRHPKIGQLTAAQFRALIALWSLAMEYHTDGVLDVAFVRTQGLRAASLRAIAESGLMSFSSDGTTITLHDYLDHQMSADELAARTQQRRSAGRRGGLAKSANAQARTDHDAPVEALVDAEYEPYSERSSGPTGRAVEAQVDALQKPEHAGQGIEGASGPLRHTRGRAPAAEEEREGENNTSSAAADTYVPRERGEQPQPFSDGWVPPEPPPDDPPPTRGALALVHDATPTEITAHPHRAAIAVSDSARTLVRLHVPAGIPRKVRADLAEQVQKLTNDRNVNRADIEAGLAEWARRPGAGPRLLPNLVADAARATPAKPAGIGKPTEKAASIHAAGQALLDQIRKNQ